MTIAFVSALPPPVHGFSVISKKMLERITERAGGSEGVVVFNRSESSDASTRSRALIALCLQVFAFLKVIVRQKPVLYVGLSGGRGQVIDGIFVILGVLRGAKIFFHHHSFAYLNRRSWVAGFLFSCARKAHHIVLCEVMRDRLQEQYQVSFARVSVLSNSAFLDEGQPNTRGGAPVLEDVKIGFLSNITEEKGIFTFFDLISRMAASGAPVRAKVAGPVSKDISEEFYRRLAEMPFADYVGPVYGQKKEDFLSDLDILLFPSRYENEAEPVTVFEATRAGVYVVATTRGCLSSFVQGGGGVVSFAEFSYIEQADKWISSYINMSASSRAEVRQGAQVFFEDNRARSLAILDEILSQLVC